jgi:hypothetical protein
MLRYTAEIWNLDLKGGEKVEGSPSDGGSEVGVQGSGQAVMQVLRRAAVPATEIEGLGHAARSQDADQLVEVRVVRPQRFIQGLSQSLQGFSNFAFAIHWNTVLYVCLFVV